MKPRLTKTIMVSEEVHAYLTQSAKKGESYDAVLRKLLGLSHSNQTIPPHSKPGQPRPNQSTPAQSKPNR